MPYASKHLAEVNSQIVKQTLSDTYTYAIQTYQSIVNTSQKKSQKDKKALKNNNENLN